MYLVRSPILGSNLANGMSWKITLPREGLRSVRLPTSSAANIASATADFIRLPLRGNWASRTADLALSSAGYRRTRVSFPYVFIVPRLQPSDVCARHRIVASRPTAARSANVDGL